MDANLTINAEALASGECDMSCTGATATGETCGGFYKMTAYEIETQEVAAGYVGCYADTPYWGIDAGEKYVSEGMMTNQVRVCEALPSFFNVTGLVCNAACNTIGTSYARCLMCRKRNIYSSSGLDVGILSMENLERYP